MLPSLCIIACLFLFLLLLLCVYNCMCLVELLRLNHFVCVCVCAGAEINGSCGAEGYATHSLWSPINAEDTGPHWDHPRYRQGQAPGSLASMYITTYCMYVLYICMNQGCKASA